jgi:MoaA/NifB/PqqE/SkfB family radical SAM enzyme
VELIREAHRLGAEAVLFTGGEPLLCDHLETLARTAHELGLSVQIATNGLGIGRASSWLGEVVDEVYVSLEGPEAIHDGVRGAGMFARLRGSLAAVRALSRRPRLVGRSVISSRNAAALEETVRAARALGLDAISFLPVDVRTEAFGGDPQSRRDLRPLAPGVDALRRAIGRLGAEGELGAFVIEDAKKLLRLAGGFLGDETRRPAPPCNAPEWSSVVEADGAVRPCFFQPSVARAGQGSSLGAVRSSDAYATALKALGSGNRTCASCVCPKRARSGVEAVRTRLSAALGRALPMFHRPGVPA